MLDCDQDKIREALQKLDNEILKLKEDVNDFNNPNIIVILPRQMYKLYDCFLNTYKNNTRFEFLRFLLDKGIEWMNDLMKDMKLIFLCIILEII